MPLTAEEKLEVHEMGRLIYLKLDAEDADGFVSLFAPDGVVAVPYGVFEGTNAIRGFMSEHIAAGREMGVKHFMANIAVEDALEGAKASFYVLKMNVADGPAAIATASGEFVVARGADGLKLKRFALSLDPAAFKRG